MNISINGIAPGRNILDTLVSMRIVCERDNFEKVLFDLGRRTAALSANDILKSVSENERLAMDSGIENFLIAISRTGTSAGLWDGKVMFLQEEQLPRYSYVSAKIVSPFTQVRNINLHEREINKFLCGYIQTLFNLVSDAFRQLGLVKNSDNRFALQTEQVEEDISDKVYLRLFTCTYDNNEWNKKSAELLDLLKSDTNEDNVTAWLDFEKARADALIADGHLRNDVYVC